MNRSRISANFTCGFNETLKILILNSAKIYDPKLGAFYCSKKIQSFSKCTTFILLYKCVQMGKKTRWGELAVKSL